MQLSWNRENDNQRCVGTKTISQPHTPDQISALAANVWGLSHHFSPNRN